MKPRPERRDPEVFEIAFTAFWPKLWKYLKGQPDITDDTEQEWKDSARKILDDNYEEDGYQLAKDFEDGGWSVDADFVDVMDGWGHELYEAVKVAVKKWAEEEKLVPLLTIGQQVKVDISTYRFKPDIRDGEITEILRDRGLYTVFVESAGHKRAGTVTSGMATTGLYVPYEDLEKLNEAPHG